MAEQQLLEVLQSLGNEKRKQSYLKDDPNYTGFGVMAGELRKIAKKIKQDQQLAQALWASGNSDARVIAAMIFDPKQLTAAECEQLIISTDSYRSRDELIFQTLVHAKAAQPLAEKWWDSEDELLARAGWSLVVAKIIDQNELEKIPLYLTKIEAELQQARGKHQDIMNRALCEIGIRYPEYTEQCLAIGEKLGVYKDVKVAKGCTSPYALEWIPAGIRNREARKKPSKSAQPTQGEQDPLMTATAEAFVKVQTIAEYLQLMSPIRQQKIQVLIDYVMANYPQAEQQIYHAPHMSIPMFVLGNDSVSFASQKNYLSIYFSNRDVLAPLVAANPKIKRQTGCVNVRDSVSIPNEALYEAIDQTFRAKSQPLVSAVQVQNPEVEAAVREYVSQQTPIRQERIRAVIQYLLDEYPQAVATMDYGPKTKIPTFKIGETYVAIASVKSHLSIHFGRFGATKIVAQAHPRIKANVGCVNIPDHVEFPMAQIKRAIDYTFNS